MSTQLNLFNEPTQQSTATAAVLVRSHLRHVKGGKPTAPHNSTKTSRVAARAIEDSGKLETQLLRVLQLVNRAGERGITRADIAHAMNKPQSTICARVNRLLRDGEIRETEEPRLPDCGGSIRQKVLVRAQ